MLSVGAGRPSATRPLEAEFIRRPGPTVGRRLSRRLKSAFLGASRQASASADARDAFRSAQADRRPQAFTPIEIGLLRRFAPGVGLRRRKRHPPGRHRPTVGRKASGGRIHSAPRANRRPQAFTPIEIGLLRRFAPGVGLRRRKRHPPGRRRPTVGCKASRGRIHSAPRANRRPQAFTPIEIGLLRRFAPGVGLRRRKRHPPGRRRPTVGHKASGGRIHSAPRANRRPQASRSNSFATIPVIPVGGGRPPRALGAPACGRPPPGDGPHNRGTAPA
jgi:hypothetical protein